ncbi:protocatechuate 3,4-dioxygenase subunit beta [Amorphus orientalis]|uniref:Protocatechuate 3,4-dioxygenase beta subunit n=1 Tax=Amorphus orientalis TaxID=649198 RepID=A0AAE3VT14_9HYPH|nr:protocatechuate 3,4-dioxygenase subunit beta [Amorphus orientalis]MDQ0317677.1 protocatechuate 3,4-dioxygenase beta subunit [Amorphus orientalis]
MNEQVRRTGSGPLPGRNDLGGFAQGYQPRERELQPPAYFPDYKSTVARSPRQALLSLPQTMTEVTGPVFGHNDLDPLDNNMIRNGQVDGEPIGERIIVHGRVMDQDGRGIPNTLVEVWQANAGGRYRHKTETYLAPLDPNFAGCGRVMTDETGHYHYWTIRPGPYPWRNYLNSWRPAHIHYSLFGPSFATRMITQMYFEGDPLIPICPIVNSVPDQKGVEAMTAKLDMTANTPHDCLAYRFDIVLRGPRQSFFENMKEGM